MEHHDHDRQSEDLRRSLPGVVRAKFCRSQLHGGDDQDQTSRDPKLFARRNQKFLSHFRLIGLGTNHRLTRWRECPILVGGRLPLGNDGHKVKAELGPKE